MSKGPNLQNISIRSEQGKQLKSLIKKFLDERLSAKEIWDVLDVGPAAHVLPDYSAVEIRLMESLADRGLDMYGQKP